MRARWFVALILLAGCGDDRRGPPQPAAAPLHDAAATTRDELAALWDHLAELDRRGDLAGAVTAAEQLLARARARGPAELAAALDAWARVLVQAGRWPEAERALDEAISLPIARTDPALRHSLLFQLATLYASQHRTDEAVDVGEQCLALAEAHYGEGTLQAASSAEVLAAVYDYAGRYGEAEALFRRVLATQDQLPATLPADRGRALANLAYNLEYQRRDGDALATYARAVPLLERASGYQRAGLADAQAGIARIHDRAGKREAAEAGYRAALATRQAALGDEHPAVAIDLHNLALVLADQHRLAEAVDACTRAEDIAAKGLDPEHPHRMETEGLCERLRKRARRR